ncbi:MAG TPA: DUF1360 domain-containing protein [Acidimicrobiales bacterium]|nr:DUF1360 domain-containing protein [Acidimicrobiales bacterium]
MGRVAEQVVEDVEDVIETVAQKAAREAEAYRGAEPRPLGALLGIIGAYLTFVAAGATLVSRKGRWPKRLRLDDLALGVVATHKLSLVLARDTITSPVRAPFTRFEGPAGEGRLKEEVRGTGWRKALGELLTCPFCLSQWVATLWAFGFLLFPRPTRMAAAILTTTTGASWLHRLDGKLTG